MAPVVAGPTATASPHTGSGVDGSPAGDSPTGWIPGLTGLVVTAIGLMGIRRAGSRRTEDEADR